MYLFYPQFRKHISSELVLIVGKFERLNYVVHQLPCCIFEAETNKFEFWGLCFLVFDIG